MVLFSFSIPRMIPDILSGKKAQTTRQPRKPRANGKKPYSVDEKVQLYYRSRSKESCNNCIKDTREKHCGFYRDFGVYPDTDSCCEHSNFFGESSITSIVHYTNQMLPGMLRSSQDGHELWMPTFDKLDCGGQVSWAVMDDFQGFDEADDWFSKQYGDDWIKKDWDCILWNGQQIARRVA